MAIINSVAIGKARRSAGNITYSTIQGRTIGRQKPVTVRNPNTELQFNQRSRLAKLVAFWKMLGNELNPYFTTLVGYGSAYNTFLSLNMPYGNGIWLDTDGFVSIPFGAYLSNGMYANNQVICDYSDGNVFVRFPLEKLRADVAIGDQLIILRVPNVGRYWMIDVVEIDNSNIHILQSGGDYFPLPAMNVDVYGAIYYSPSRKVSSTCRWMEQLS